MIPSGLSVRYGAVGSVRYAIDHKGLADIFYL